MYKKITKDHLTKPKIKQNVSIPVVGALCCQQDQLLFYNSTFRIKRNSTTVQEKYLRPYNIYGQLMHESFFSQVNYGALPYSGRIIITNIPTSHLKVVFSCSIQRNHFARCKVEIFISSYLRIA